MPKSLDPAIMMALVQQLCGMAGCTSFVRDALSGEPIFGYPGDGDRANLVDSIHPGDRRRYLRALASGKAYRVRYRRADGAGNWRHLVEQAQIATIGDATVWIGAVVDTSERDAAAKALQESEAQLRGIVETQTEWVTRQTLDGRYTFVNEAYCRYMGMTRKALMEPGYDNYASVRHDGRARFMAARAALSPQRPSFTIELVVDHPDGSVRIQEWTEKGLFDRAGRAWSFQAVGRDITNRVRTERALREREAELRGIVETQTEWVTRRRAHDKAYSFVNEAYCRYLGMTRAELLAPDFYDGASVVPEDLARYLAERATRTPQQPAFTIEIAAHHPDGSFRIEEWTEITLFDADGCPYAYQAVGRDMTSQRRAEAALRESEQRFRRFAEAHPVPLCALRTEDWRIMFVNPAYLMLFELTWEELDAADKRTQWADLDKRAPYYERVKREGRVDNCEVLLRRKDGTTFPALLSSRLMDFGGVETVVNSVVDLSRQRAAEAEILRQREIMHQQEKMTALGSLLAGVAHELNNPLSIVVGYAAMMREDARTRSAREQAEQIHVAAQRCARIVKTFLAMARQKPPEFGPVDLVQTVDASLELAAYGLRTSGVRVTTELPAELPPVHGDADQLHQVVANLVVNAKQALQDIPGPRQLEIRVIPDGREVRLIVADNGPGIPAETLRRIFEPFFTTKPAGVGTGLGLSVCHGIVTAHGGRIEAHSVDGQGTRIEVALPMTSTELPNASAAAAATASVKAAHILVVDDEPEIVRLISRVLTGDGHQVDGAGDGEAALIRIARGGIDLLISDLRMPGMDGAALLRKLRTTHPSLARTALLLTGDLMSATSLPELRDDAILLLEKPIDPEELRRAVRGRLTAALPA